MKTLRFFILITIITLQIQSCKKVEEIIDKFTQFDMTFDESFTLPAIPLIIDEPIPFYYTVSTNIDEVLPANNTTKDLIEEVRLSEASFKIVSPTGGTFSFLKSVSFYISAEGLEEVLIASNMQISETIGGELILDIEDQDLTAYLKKDEITVKLEIATDEPTEEEMDLLIHMVFSVDAKLLGI